jgi:hypothetical protein
LAGGHRPHAGYQYTGSRRHCGKRLAANVPAPALHHAFGVLQLAVAAFVAASAVL